MKEIKEAFRLLPDSIIITDSYGYILDFNHAELFAGCRRGVKISRYMPDFKGELRDEYQLHGKVYQRTVTKVFEHQRHRGYIVYLADITEKKRLLEQNLQKSRELQELTDQQARANEELKEYAEQAEMLTAYAEQLRIAHHIHDDSGHAITALHAISQMCLQIREKGTGSIEALLEEGIAICRKMLKDKESDSDASIEEMLTAMQRASPFAIKYRIKGGENEFSALFNEQLRKICKEAYHNTLAHSMADRLEIEAEIEENRLRLSVFDNGKFRGNFEKGFGLSMLERNVLASGGQVFFHAKEGEGFGIVAEWRREDGNKNQSIAGR